MGFMDKLKFWKSEEPESLKPLGDQGLGNEPSAQPQQPQGMEDTGIGKDRTPGLGGTGELGESYSTGTEEGQFGAGQQEDVEFPKQEKTDVSLRGPSYEKPPESGDVRHAPLSPMEHKPAPAAQAPSRDIEVVAAKVDAIKANVESINQRLESIERMLMTQEKRRLQW